MDKRHRILIPAFAGSNPAAPIGEQNPTRLWSNLFDYADHVGSKIKIIKTIMCSSFIGAVFYVKRYSLGG